MANTVKIIAHRMVGITPLLFQVEGDYQVEGVKEAAGAYSAIKLFWEDGWTETINRNK